MADTLSGSAVPRRRLGRYLRDLRYAAGMTIKDAACPLEWSEVKMWRIETGQTSLRSLDVMAMCDLYRATADITAALMGLAKETKAKGWWQAYGDVVPGHFDLLIGLEAASARHSMYQPELVPGLFQTEELNGGGAESEPPAVYSESFTGALYLDKPNEVERYSQAFRVIWDAALDDNASRDRIQQAAEEMRDG